MKKGFLLIDANNIGFAATAGARRKGQQILKVGDQETGGVFNFIRSVQNVCRRAPILTPICLWDGVSWRRKVFAEYKAGREVKPTTKAEKNMDDIRSAFNAQRGLMQQALELLGVTQMRALNLEADDLGGMVVRRYAPQGKTILLYTGDKDWVQLVGPKVTWFDPVRNLRISPKTLKESLGVDTPQQWLEVKALHGDSSDEITGVGGIGEKGAIELVLQFGSMAEFFNRSIDGTLPPLASKFMALATDNAKQDIYRRNIRLMDLRTNQAPEPVNLTINHGAFDRVGFDQFCRDLLFQSILTEQEWCDPFLPESMKEAA